jgi:hypothetical protein
VTVPVYPNNLPGLGFSFHKKPRFDVRLAAHATGRETRARKYQRPLFDFELTYDGLDATTTNIYGGLGAQSFQTLAGFFLQMQGRFAPFLFIDPTDNAVVGQALGTGDGSTTDFPFVRSIGGYVGPVDAVTIVTGVFLNGVRQLSGWSLSAVNVLTFNAAPAAGVVVTASFAYGYAVRFSDDVEDFEEFMSMLMAVKTVKLQGVRDLLPIIAQQRIVYIIDDPTITSWTVPVGTINVEKIEGIGGGAGAGTGSNFFGGLNGGEGGGAYAIAPNPSVNAGDTLAITVGRGGAGGTTLGADGANTTVALAGAGHPFILVAAAGGGDVNHGNGSGAGGLASNCFPLAGAQSGGNGGLPGARQVYGACGGGGGGGGAAGPLGPGQKGADGVSVTNQMSVGSGGGAAAGGMPGSGQNGGHGPTGSPGGGPGAGGTNGSGGGGGPIIDGSTGGPGGDGGTGVSFLGVGIGGSSSSGGPGGGGGSGSGSGLVSETVPAFGGAGGDGAKWGGGGAGGGSGPPAGTSGPGGAGGGGAVIITLTVATT